MADKRFRLKRILCAVDFSPASLRAFDLAIRLASVNGARIQLLHVIPRIVASVMDIPITTSRWTAAQEEKAKRELPKLRARALRHGVSASTEIRIGDVDVQILKAAKDVGADALAIGTQGRRGFERWILGSVAERILRHSPIHLAHRLLRQRPNASVIRRVLVASDLSKEAHDGAGYAASVAQAKVVHRSFRPW